MVPGWAGFMWMHCDESKSLRSFLKYPNKVIYKIKRCDVIVCPTAAGRFWTGTTAAMLVGQPVQTKRRLVS